MLKHAGLAAALTAYCAEVSRAADDRGDLHARRETSSRIDTETALCLYRIAQEALHNVVKHAGARQAEVRLLRTGDSAELTIADDGKGFDIAETRKSGKGLGLVSINERVRLAGGTLSIVTELNKGTRVRVRLPTSRSRAQRRCGRRVRTIRSDLTEPHHSRLSMRRYTVLVADDHAIVKEGLVRLLKEHDFDVVGAVGDGHELIDAARRLRPDVIVTDLSMPGLSGLDVLARLKAEHIDSKVIVLTMHHDADLATRAMRAGASRLPAETLGRRGAVDRHSPGLGRSGVPHADADEGGHRADGGLPGPVRAAADVATT